VKQDHVRVPREGKGGGDGTTRPMLFGAVCYHQDSASRIA
jgi:hypothetical protein